MQLIWVYDELFVTPFVWETVFHPRGIAARPVLTVRGAPLKTVVQLVIEHESRVVTNRLVEQKCERCGRVKYVPDAAGRFPPFAEEPEAPILRTSQYFGTGGQA